MKNFDFKKPIKENWNAIEDVINRARERTGDPEAGFNPDFFYFFLNHRPLDLKLKFRKKKKSGNEFTKKYYHLVIRATHCPFTGLPLYEEIKEEEKPQ